MEGGREGGGVKRGEGGEDGDKDPPPGYCLVKGLYHGMQISSNGPKGKKILKQQNYESSKLPK